jgi:hypothetical protein
MLLGVVSGVTPREALAPPPGVPHEWDEFCRPIPWGRDVLS